MEHKRLRDRCFDGTFSFADLLVRCGYVYIKGQVSPLTRHSSGALPTERSVRDNSPKTAPFCGIMRQNPTVRVSVTVGFFLLYQQKFICFGCYAVL